MNSRLIADDGSFPMADGVFDACVLDNVLEHIAEPRRTLDECRRVTRESGGLIVAVPGVRGYASDSDHKRFYDEKALRLLDDRWSLRSLFSIPFFFTFEILSRSVRQYCLVAVYKKA
jgi:SAM-dependent methyltransferase